MRCPTCKQPAATEGNAFRPFCCERCKLVDLGRWLDGSYAVPGEPAEEEDLIHAERELAERELLERTLGARNPSQRSPRRN